MKISPSEFKKACGYGKKSRAAGRTGHAFTPAEVHILKEVLKQMPERAVRHLNYSELKKACAKVSSQEVADKILMRLLADTILCKE